MLNMRETSGKIISMDEQALIHDAQAGNLEAFNTLILHYQDSIYNTALRIKPSRTVEKDIESEAIDTGPNTRPSDRPARAIATSIGPIKEGQREVREPDQNQ